MTDSVRAMQGQPWTDRASSVDAAEHLLQGGHDARDWGSLDQGLLALIAPRLEDNERNVASARLVCRQWAAELPQGCVKLQVQGDGPAGWGHRFCGLEDLAWRCPENISGQSWPKLKALRLENCTDSSVLNVLKDLPSLSSLKLCRSMKITDVGLKELKQVPGLTSLDLEKCENITDAGLKELQNVPALTTLDLTLCSKITDAGLEELRHITSLASLNLGNCANITDAGLRKLKHVPGLTSLSLSRCSKITDAGLTELKHVPGLTCLDLSSCYNGLGYGLGGAQARSCSGLPSTCHAAA